MLKNKSGISSVLASRSPQDNELKLHVYRKALQAPAQKSNLYYFDLFILLS